MSEIKKIESRGAAADSRITLVVSHYNKFIVDRLLKGCLDILKQGGIEEANICQVQVPGAFEIPVAVEKIIDATDVDAVITLGAVIRGETPHFDIIANECARGIGSIAIATMVPVVFGVLTVDTVEQAMDRSGAEESNKGSEAAQTALDMISVFEQVG